MIDKDFLLQKIWGSWTGKIAGDTDCNAGNAGAIIGAFIGQDLIPSYAKRFIRGDIIPGLKEWIDKSLISLSKRTFTQALRFETLK